MKKFLSIFLVSIFFLLFFVFPKQVFAAEAPVQLGPGDQVPDGNWVIDKEVTFIGKNAARAGKLLDFTLKNYNWVCVKQAPNGQCDDRNNPLAGVWLTTVIYIVTPLLFVVIIATSIIIIATRGRSLTITRFIPRFIAVLLLIFLSFAILRYFYIFTDIIQGFFLRPPGSTVSCPPKCISQTDLLFVGWDYDKFIGLRLIGGTGDQNAESAFISLLLTKLTALTYYVMVSILFLRKIILWLFIIVSPIFPLLLLFYPIRNTGKIWIGEFFRWLLYAPLFAIFLKGLVSLWRDQIPLFFGNPAARTDPIIYPTAVNILLGGPKEFVTPANSVNLTETFALYVVSLIMLWGVIILPWILLQIFLDYASNLGVGDSAVMKTLVNKISNLQGPPGSPLRPASGGTAINLPFAKKFNLPILPTAPAGMARDIPTSTSMSQINSKNIAYMPTAQAKAQVLSLTNLSIPTLTDIAKYDTSLISRDSDRQKETISIRENLEKIANPSTATSTTEREKYTEIHEKLSTESKSGNTLATSILSAATSVSSKSARSNATQIKNILSQIANPTTSTASSMTTGATSVINREKIAQLNESLVKAKKEGNSLAASILSVNTKTTSAEIDKLQERIMEAKTKGEPIAAQISEIATQASVAALPIVNRVQTVSSEDYKAVKDMWKENYKNLEVPEGMSGTRAEWVKEDISKIEEIVGLLSSNDTEQVSRGMEQVSSILPFLLVGGFSQAEIVSYLKAKLDAAKEVAAEIILDEEDKVSVNVKKTATASQTMTASLSEDSGDDDSSESSLSGIHSSAQAASASRVSDELLSLSNLQLPKLTDIVQYEIRHLTKDKTESERVEKIHEALAKIGNPTSIPTSQEREQYEKLQEKLAQESLSGNMTADAILSAVSQLTRVTGQLDATLSEVKTVLMQIANPNTVAAVDDRDYYTRLHAYLEKESKEKNNNLAQQVLSINENTKFSDIKIIKDQLATANQEANPAIPQLTGAVKDFARIKKLRDVIQQIITPSKLASATDRDNFTKLHDTLVQESAKGNTLATSLLSVNDKLSDSALREIHNKLQDAGQKGEPLASTILSQVSSPSGFSTSGRLQEVKPEDLEEVRSLWQKAYKQYLVPAEFTEDTKGRTEWISKDISDIEETINLLNSTDSDKKNAGMEKVSSILPFLLLGGYSFNDINSYLNIKLEAAKYSLKDLQQEEDTQVDVGVRKNIAINNQSLSTSVPPEATTGEAGENNTAQSYSKNISIPESSNEVLNWLNLTPPKITDIARYDSALIFRDKAQAPEIKEIHEKLEKVANPSVISTQSDKEKFQSLQKRIVEQSNKQNAAATSILNAGASISQRTLNASTEQIKNVLSKVMNSSVVGSDMDRKRFDELRNLIAKDAQDNNNKLASALLSVNEKTTVPEIQKIGEQLRNAQLAGNELAESVIKTINKTIWESDAVEKAKTIFMQIANPVLVEDTVDRAKYSKVHDVLLKASSEGNNFASEIISVNEKTDIKDIERLQGQIQERRVKNDPIALEVSALMRVSSPILLPAVNRVQKVEQDDFNAVQQMWAKNYKTLEIPESLGETRLEWIKNDISKIDNIIKKLDSTDESEIESGTEEVSSILPFLLIGGFSKSETISYLNAKQAAAKEALTSLSNEEEEKVELVRKIDNKPQEMSVKEENSDTEKKS